MYEEEKKKKLKTGKHGRKEEKGESEKSLRESLQFEKMVETPPDPSNACSSWWLCFSSQTSERMEVNNRAKYWVCTLQLH